MDNGRVLVTLVYSTRHPRFGHSAGGQAGRWTGRRQETGDGAVADARARAHARARALAACWRCALLGSP